MNKYLRPLGENELKNHSFKSLLGGGSEHWNQRGRAQLDFMIAFGLSPGAMFLDIGCGPLRAGIHFIEYLGDGCYGGIDFNTSFIQLGRNIIASEGLSQKRPQLTVVNEFKVSGQLSGFDLGLAFSVLNHCDIADRTNFLRNIPAAFNTGARIYVSHAGWFNSQYHLAPELSVTRVLSRGDAPHFEAAWTPEELTGVFPIIEFSVRIANGVVPVN